MKFNYFSTLIISLILFISCNDDFDTEIVKEDPQTVNYDEIKVLNGRLYFPNKSTFQNYYKEIRNKDDVEVANVLQNKFYSKNFYSLKPIVNERTEKIEIARHLSKITVRESDNGLQQTQFSTNDDLLDSFDDLEDIFGEDVFTSFLNQDAEIQISNEVYKYTDAGLFIANVKDVTDLNRYLEEENISKNLLKRTPEQIRLKYIEENNPCGGLGRVRSFKHFVAERCDKEDIPGPGPDPGGGSGGGFLRGTTNNKLDYVFTSTLSLEPRYYYNFTMRQNKGKSIKNNTANYISAELFYVPDVFSSTNRKNLQVQKSFGIIPKYGLRRNLSENLVFELAIGFGYLWGENKTKGRTAALDLRLCLNL